MQILYDTAIFSVGGWTQGVMHERQILLALRYILAL